MDQAHLSGAEQQDKRLRRMEHLKFHLNMRKNFIVQ